MCKIGDFVNLNDDFCEFELYYLQFMLIFAPSKISFEKTRLRQFISLTSFYFGRVLAVMLAPVFLWYSLGVHPMMDLKLR